MLTISEYFQSVVEKLSVQKSDEEALQLTKILFEDLFGIKNVEKNNNPDVIDTRQIDDAVERILQGEPIQYVTGIAHFYGYAFKVGPQVLIPRPETEELVWSALQWAKSVDKRALRILDIGTGSGCIALVLKQKLPEARVVAIDISTEALKLARNNSELMETEIEFHEMDFSDIYQWQSLGNFDLVVSNPPYVSVKERQLLDRQIFYEPEEALFPPEGDEQYFYKKILKFCKDHLVINGCLLMELNEFQAEKTYYIAKKHSFFREIKLIKDMQGKKRILQALRY